MDAIEWKAGGQVVEALVEVFAAYAFRGVSAVLTGKLKIVFQLLCGPSLPGFGLVSLARPILVTFFPVIFLTECKLLFNIALNLTLF